MPLSPEDTDLANNRAASNNQPLLSICCIAYNLEVFIHEAIDSFLMQKTSFPFEIVIGEDHSSDDTLGIIRGYQDRYPALIRIITSDANVGLNANFARTLLACRGQYVALCDGDDYWTDPLKLQKQVDFLEQNPEYVITYGPIVAMRNGQIDTDFALAAEADADASRLKYGWPIYTHTTCFRNLVTHFPAEYFLTHFNDLFLWSLLSVHGNGKFMNDVTPSVYRLRNDSFFSLKSKAHKDTMALISNALFISYYQRQGDPETAAVFKALTIKSIIKSSPSSQLLHVLLGRSIREPLRALRRFFATLFTRTH